MYPELIVTEIIERLEDDGIVVLVGLFAHELEALGRQVATRWPHDLIDSEASDALGGRDQTEGDALWVVSGDALLSRSDSDQRWNAATQHQYRLLVLTTASKAWPLHLMMGIPGVGDNPPPQPGAGTSGRDPFDGHQLLARAWQRHSDALTADSAAALGPSRLESVGWNGQTAWQVMYRVFEGLGALDRRIIGYLALARRPMSFASLAICTGRSVSEVATAGIFLTRSGWTRTCQRERRPQQPKLLMSRLGDDFVDVARQRGVDLLGASATEQVEQMSTRLERAIEDAQPDELRHVPEVIAVVLSLAGATSVGATALREVEQLLAQCFRFGLWRPLGLHGTPLESLVYELRYPREAIRRIWTLVEPDSQPNDARDMRIGSPSAGSSDFRPPRGRWQRTIRLVEKAEEALRIGSSSSVSLLIEQLRDALDTSIPPQLRARLALRAALLLADAGELDTSRTWLDLARADSSTHLSPRWQFERELLEVALLLVEDNDRRLEEVVGRLLGHAMECDDSQRLEVALALQEVAGRVGAQAALSRPADPSLASFRGGFPEVAAAVGFVHAEECGARAGLPGGQLAFFDELLEEIPTEAAHWRLQVSFCRLLRDAVDGAAEGHARLRQWMETNHLVEWLGGGTAENIRLPPWSRFLWERYGDNKWLFGVADRERDDLRHLTVHPQGYWFRTDAGAVVDLTGRTALRRLFRHFIDSHREGTLASFNADALINIGWPRQVLDIDSARARVYTAIRQLRDLGLRDFLVTRHDGYALGSHVVVHVRDLTAESARHALTE